MSLFQGDRAAQGGHTGLSAMFEGCELDNTPAQGRLDLTQGTAACRALQFNSQQQYCSQTSIFAASQELGTQDFATPAHNRRAPPSQLASQPMVAPALGAPPACEMPGKRGRMDCDQEENAPMNADFSFPQIVQHPGGELKGTKKVRALASANVQSLTDMSTCSVEEADAMDVKSDLRHHAVVAGAPGSFSHRFEEVGLLGEGDFGKVLHVRSKTDRQPYAVKMTTDHRELNDAEVKRLFFEGQLMATLARHKSVTPAVLGWGDMWMESMVLKNQQRYRVYMCMELCQGNLASKLGHHKFSEQELVDIIRAVASVLEIMHRMNFAHLDVKPGNILQSTLSPRLYHLGDYGNAVRTEGAWEVLEGDRAYLPLELLQGHCRDKKAADIFSLGISVLELAQGKPLPQDGDDYHILRTGELPPLQYSQPLCSCIKDMMHPEPSKRPKAQKLMRSPLSPACFSSFTEGNENAGFHANIPGKAQISQLVGNGQGAMWGSGKVKTASAGSKDSKRKGDSKGSRSAAPAPTLNSFLKTTL